AEFSRYFAEGQGQLWERQALCKARVVYASPELAQRTLTAVEEAAYGLPWRADDLDTMREMRQRLEQTAAPGNLKRGPRGIVDIEFLVQMLQLRYGFESAAVRLPNTLSALAALRAAGHLHADDAEFLTRSYRFLRTIQARLRLMSTTARDTLPDDPHELDNL